MAAAVVTVTKLTQGTLGRGMFVVFTVGTDGGDYAAGGLDLALANLSRYRREPDIVLISSTGGFVWAYDYVNKKAMLFVNTAGGVNAALGEHTAVAIVAGARTGNTGIAFWFTPVP